MKRWLILTIAGALCSMALFFCPAEADCLEIGQEAVTAGLSDEKEEPLKLYAQSAVLMDGETGRILYGKGEDVIRPMASTTKIMTCILALELGDEEEFVTASRTAVSQPKVRLGVKEGEEYRLGDLLYALMLESYNDAAVMIAEHIGGSVKGFAALMNEKAEDLGCRDTYFITPNGLDGKEKDGQGRERIHSTTAADLALVMRYCVMGSPKKEQFLSITRTQNHSFGDRKGRRSFQCMNHNALLTMMEGVLSGKTGFTGGAGYSYVGALEDKGRVYVITLLGCGWPPHKTYKWTDARRLYAYGTQHFIKRELPYPNKLDPVAVKGGVCWKEEGEEGQTDRIGLTFGIPQEEEGFKLLMAEGEQVQIRERVPHVIEAPVKKGQRIGDVEYVLGGIVVKRLPLYASWGVEKMDFSKAVRRTVRLFCSFV